MKGSSMGVGAGGVDDPALAELRGRLAEMRRQGRWGRAVSFVAAVASSALLGWGWSTRPAGLDAPTVLDGVALGAAQFVLATTFWGLGFECGGRAGAARAFERAVEVLSTLIKRAKERAL